MAKKEEKRAKARARKAALGRKAKKVRRQLVAARAKVRTYRPSGGSSSA